MGNPGFQELIFFFSILLIGIPVVFYYWGKRSGYKKGQLEVYKKMEEQRGKQ
jgi:hypothetical protein